MQNNSVHCGEAVSVLSNQRADTIDLTVFSPPYDNLREYQGYSFDLNALGKELYRVTKDGGVVVMVIQDQTINRFKSLTSFKTIIDWCENIGFNLFECNIYQKNGKDGAWWSKRFRVDHEYMPIFVKGKKPNVFNKDPIKIPSKHAGKIMKGGANRNKNGETVLSAPMKINDKKCPGTIWDCSNGGDKVYLKRQHPATFPDKIPYNFIQVFTNQGGIVLDPMCGSGSSLITAKILKRKYIGIDISEKYCDIAKERIKSMQSNMVKGFKNNP